MSEQQSRRREDRQQDESETRHRLLVVDDDPNTVRLVRGWFADKPFDIFEAENGKEGLRQATEIDPDVILLDLRMPGLDGMSVARELKGNPLTRATPVILLTACRDVNAKVEGFSAGADDYVTKPFEFEEIDARIAAMLRKRDRLVTLEKTVRDLEASNQQLEQLLMVDEKTGLYNFREFQRRLKDEWQRANRYSTPLSVVFFDLDHFKALNDTLGHQAGDQALVEFAMLVTGGARTNDTAARYGGEEFAVILPHTDRQMSIRVADRIRQAVKEFVFLQDEVPTRITVSAGVATFPSAYNIDSVDALVRAADLALYQAKDLGRDRVVEYDESEMSKRRKQEIGHASPRSGSGPNVEPTTH